MRSLYESILDTDKDITTRAKVKVIVDNMSTHKRVSQEDCKWLEKQVAVWKPIDQDELYDVIENYLKYYGGKRCSLNWIDTSDCTDFTDLFLDSEFNGDISKWNTSKVTTLNSTFCGSEFNGDLSKWDVSNVKSFTGTFAKSVYNKPLKSWKVTKGEDFSYMFRESSFDQDISNWDMGHAVNIKDMFFDCPIKEKYKPEFT